MDNDQIKDLEFVRSNIFSLYEWTCSLEDNVLRMKKVLKKMKDNCGLK